MLLISKAITLNASKRLQSFTKLTYGRQSILNGVKFINTDAKGKETEKYTPVYTFPLIRAVSIINRLKLYHTIFTGVVVPVSCTLYYINIVSSDLLKASCVCGISGGVSLYVFGFLCNKFIGIVYINESENKVKVAHVDFWGGRKETIVSIEDITPMSEMPFKVTDGLYRTFKRSSTNETLKLSLQQCIVLDQGKFNKIFGAP